MHKHRFQLQPWLATTGFLACCLTILPLLFPQPGLVFISLLLFYSLIGLSYFVKNN